MVAQILARRRRSLAALTALLLATGALTVTSYAEPQASTKEPDAACEALLDRDPFLPPPAEVAAILTSCQDKGLVELGRGVGLLASGDLDGAAAAINAARTLLPESPYPLYYVADLELRRGDFAAAQRTLGNALALRPNFAGAHSLLGDAHAAAGDKAKALSSYRMAIALAPGRAHPHLALGRACLALGEPDHARVALMRALELDPNLLEARYLLGRAYLNAGNLHEGCAVLTGYVHDADGTPDEIDRVTRARAILKRFADES
jgi:tetratricopeptide (TPR) repeat protein